MYDWLRLGKCLAVHIKGALNLIAGEVDLKGDLIAGGVAAVGSHLDVAFLPDSGIRAVFILFPQLDLHHVGLYILQDPALVDLLS